MEVPPSRWDINAYYDPDPQARGKIATRWGGFLTDIDRFDAGFFGISRREAMLMDPQQRVLLEVVWEAFENAGQRADVVAGSSTGVFIGVSRCDYGLLQNLDPDKLDVHSGPGTAGDVIAGRIAYLFDLQGPAIALDTACSSSLVAVHMACQSLRAGECGMAVAGGVNLILTPMTSICMSRMRVLAADGKCKAFDSRADGFVRSEGCGVVVLKRLADAVAAADPMLAVIRGSAINQGGRSDGLAVPNVHAQQAVLSQALTNAGIRPREVGYVETHGAGTPVGDPIEIEALAAVYGHGEGEPCTLGAVKTNIGHTEAAAGMAGLIKAVLALEREAIPGNLHFERLNPKITLEGTRLELARGLRGWPRAKRPRYAGVSAFGWAGTNAHLLLEEAPATPECEAANRAEYLLPISARTPNALREKTGQYPATLNRERLADVCYTAGLRRTHHQCRVAVAGRTGEGISAALADAEIREPNAGRGMVFVYPGQGGQWAGMGTELYEAEPEFRHAIDECAEAIRAEAGWNVLDAIRGRAGWEDMERVQPALFAISVGLTALWRHWGIQPDVVVGHSLGEAATAYVAGALGLRDAVKVICRRASLLQRLRGRGAMALVELRRADTEAALAGCHGRVTVAALNSPRTTVISGDRESVESLLCEWESRGVYCRRVAVDVAAHSPQVKELEEELALDLAAIEPRPTLLRMQSTVHTQEVRGEELGAAYWIRNLREPVRFSEVIAGLVSEGYRTFIEVGPHPVLAHSIVEILGPERGVAVGSLRRGAAERLTMLQNLGALYQAGVEVAWGAVNGEHGRHVDLPGYAWQRERYWIEGAGLGRLNGRVTVAGEGERSIHVRQLHMVEGHRVLGRDVMPAAEYLRVALDAARDVLGEGTWELRDVEFSRMLESAREAQLLMQEEEEACRFRIYSRGEGERTWQHHGSGRVLPPNDGEPRRVDLLALQKRCAWPLTHDEFYARTERQRVEYSAGFRQVTKAWVGSGEALVRLGSAHLDASMQGLNLAAGWNDGDVHVPVRARRVKLDPGWAGAKWSWMTWKEDCGSVIVMNEEGLVVGEVEGVEVACLAARHEEWLWEVHWEPAERIDGGRLEGRWLIVGAGNELAAALKVRGANCVVATPEIAASAVAGMSECNGVVWLADKGAEGLKRAVETVQALSCRGWRDAPRLWLVTRGTQPAGEDGVVNSDGAGLWGFGRTLRYEHPEFRCTLVDTTTGFEELAREIAAGDSADQVALRTEGRYVPRLQRMRKAADAVGPLAPTGGAPGRNGHKSISTEGAYLITGGLGALGLLIARRLAERGARRLALAGRHPATALQQRAIDGLRARGAEVCLYQADVSDFAKVADIIAEVGPSLRGVIHAAAVLDDHTVAKLDSESIERVWKPKVDGAWNLHRATLGYPLDFFVLMSSGASVVGSPGQAHYAASNAELDALAQWRRRQGLPGLSIAWAPWNDVGLAAASDKRGVRLAGRGLKGMEPDLGLEILEDLLRRDTGHTLVMQLDLRQWRQCYPRWDSALFSGFDGESGNATESSHAIRVALASAEPAKRRGMLEDHVRSQMEPVLGSNAANIPADATFSSLGFDSLLAVEFRNRLESTLGLRLPATVVWAYPSVRALAGHLAANMGLLFAGATGISEADRIEALSEAAAEAELIAKLKTL